jgi:hypothetical protein
MSDLLNTHTYDGKIDIHQLPGLDDVKQLSIDQKRERGGELIQAAIDMDPIALSFLNNIIASIGTPSNVDSTNGLVADDIICLCWLYRENPDFLSILEIQLMDMSTGFCPQGRTHRLFQTVLAFI